MVFRNVIVCRMVPGSEDKVGPVFAHYDELTRPQDLGVIGRILLSHHDLYIHVIERTEDPEVSGQRRGLPAFQKIAEEIAPYVTPYPRYWQNPSHSRATEFYRWTPDGDGHLDAELTLVVGRIEPGTEPDIERVFKEHDAGTLPSDLGVMGRFLYSIDDVYVHLLEQDPASAEATRADHGGRPAFAKVMQDLDPYIKPYGEGTERGTQSVVATPFYRWRAKD